MNAQLTQFQISKRYADDSGISHAVDVDVNAGSAWIYVDEYRLLASPSDIDWLIEALTKAKKLIEGEQA